MLAVYELGDGPAESEAFEAGEGVVVGVKAVELEVLDLADIHDTGFCEY